ncbi:glutamate-1-semialdehyde 2,1-aminomutase [Sulfolobus acidocaldarius]|uniref:Glutamate-1-semialdehyde 2,1-aminomutase n=3 Tax=Sulfolobus acidocaldarius TaxID=2285 RepID=GSA_SULAC|nr:glutamate-1-semialdehyde 2,1-aminomutase [Sulfolobus acidocaldarius]Q4JAM7.1 RecName: Full=Glutamate-1-semialdehyde 2,1-aminomutase; Short=GSA; AltName: Full=Glutamate-1-semialdehyde aminotransferase; Short=GSA-AT [Sulfolobus acidocaldarius DSM 639]AAY80152.1 glutamate-1-semialdehyde aminotransferase [Sulfolobus acidocaldarius DSM 639]AGE70728.1 glutamate-1-semialdehyde aminotransferase [Sulfolobus acidocaldarius N8]AGE73000.1 glutamate-1-semialdehyde aminotransferase [Sulfolobus acidocaldar
MSEKYWNIASHYFAGGVNSPVRAAVKPYPFYVERAEGAYLYTADNKQLIDYVLGYGPLILGHANQYVTKKIIEQVNKGWLYGTPSPIEIELARKISHHLPSAQKIRFVNSGTEATMLALRLARAYTGREKIIKFHGNYHGAHDYLLLDAGSAFTEFNVNVYNGIPKSIVNTIRICEYNDAECVEKLSKSEDIAGVIVEPVMGNMGVILPDKDFLERLREITLTYNSVLIFDEVITGFRLGLGGAQGTFNVTPDLTTLGKIIGGGLPIGAVAGKKEIIDMLTPAGKVFNAGTFNANPLTMTAGLATIEVLERENVHEVANRAVNVILEELVNALDKKIPNNFVINHIGSMFQVFFGVKKVSNATEAKLANKEMYQKFHNLLLQRGVFIPPSQFETIFTSYAHKDVVVNTTLEILRKVVQEL